MGTDLITLGEPEDDNTPVYLPLALGQDEVAEILRDNLVPGETVSLNDLIRVKIPGAGGTIWEVPDLLEGVAHHKELSGVVIHRQRRRGFYVDKYDGGTDRPDCSSDDAITGTVNDDAKNPEAAAKLGAGGACVDCPLNVFPDDDSDETGKPCKEKMQLFILRPGTLLPIVVSIPPGSLKNSRQFFMGLMANAYKPTSVVTTLSLKKMQNAGGIDYAQVEFKIGGALDASAKARMGAYAEQIKPYLRRVDVPFSDEGETGGEAAAA